MTDTPVYVVAFKDPTWVVADTVVELATSVGLAVASGGTAAGQTVKGAVQAAENLKKVVDSVRTGKSISDVLKVVRETWALVKSIKKAADASAKVKDAVDKAKEALEKLKEKTLKVEPWHCANIVKEGYDRFLKVSGYAELLGAKTVKLFIFREGGGAALQHVEFSTNNDHSWVVEKDFVVRAKYGTLTQSRRGCGELVYKFSAEKSEGKAVNDPDCRVVRDDSE
ncbi:hypothetical protein SSP35_43_00190, partial [Streptomyces sp. NBRC 110611]|uniref:hypothetical protein n=1 Tax=Streptomyces sp. NBRC 110611 TaxID=1621259 RepID=UPI000857975F